MKRIMQYLGFRCQTCQKEPPLADITIFAEKDIVGKWDCPHCKAHCEMAIPIEKLRKILENLAA